MYGYRERLYCRGGGVYRYREHLYCRDGGVYGYRERLYCRGGGVYGYREHLSVGPTCMHSVCVAWDVSAAVCRVHRWCCELHDSSAVVRALVSGTSSWYFVCLCLVVRSMSSPSGLACS